MSFNTKNPTIKRILKEAQELSTSPSPDYHAAPLETNLFEWHFTLRGPPSSAFADGLYHGRIVLPPAYPLRPPSFRFLTPSGRFEVNREICLSISGFHEESWQPAWGLRTAIVALRSFMETDAKGQLGGVDASQAVRERFARESKDWKCTGCGKSNEQIINEVKDEAAAQGNNSRNEEKIPEELSLGYKDELGEKNSNTKGKERQTPVPATGPETTSPVTTMPRPEPVASPKPEAASRSVPTRETVSQQAYQAQATSSAVRPASTVAAAASPGTRQTASTFQELSTTPWIDRAIVGIALALAFLLLKKWLIWAG